MRRLLLYPQSESMAVVHGPKLIATGLTVLMAAVCWPVLPAVLGMALVVWGATGATLARFGRHASLPTVLIMHVAVYGALYALFVGATLHASGGNASTIGIPVLLDLAASVWPIAAALRLIVGQLREALSHG